MVSWGPAVNTATNGARVGIELSYTVSGATATVTFELWLWTKRASFGSSAGYSRGGSFGSGSGSFSYNHSSNSSDWPSSNQTRIGTWTTTRTLQYGSTQSVSASGSVSGLGGSIPDGASHSRSITLPSRGYDTPTAPSGAFVFPENDYTRARLEWTRNSSGSAPYEKVQVQRRHIDGQFTPWATRANLPGSASSYTDNVADNWHYHYRVRAGNSSGWSGWLDMGRLNTTPPTPAGVGARLSGDNIVVTWTHGCRIPAANVRTIVQHSADAGPWATVATLTGLPSSWIDYGPSIAQTHRYRVRIEVTEWGTQVGPWGTSSVVALAAPPSAPTGLGPVEAFDATETHVFTWEHVPTDGSEQTAYQIRRRLQGEATWTTMAEVTSGTADHTLPAGTYDNGDTIEVQVRTWGTHPDPSPYSATLTVAAQAKPTVTIDMPTDGEVIDRSAVNITWGFSQEQGLPQTGWRVELRHQGAVVQSRSGTHAAVGAVLLRGLDNGETYEAAVMVRAGTGWSDWDTVTFTTDFVAPPTPDIEVTWDVELGAAVVQIQVPAWSTGTAEPDHVQLWRAIGEGDWLLIADNLPMDTAVVDPVPAIGDGTVNYYKATVVSLMPSTADSVTFPLPVTTRMARGWVYLNGGPGMGQVCRVRANTRRRDREGIERHLEQWAGRTSPVSYSGTAVVLEWDVSAMLAPDVHGASTRADLVALQKVGDPVCYRDPVATAPARWFGSMGLPDFSWRSIQGDVLWSMVQVDYVEGLDEDGSAA